MSHCHLSGISPSFTIIHTTAIHGILQGRQISLHEPFFSSIIQVIWEDGVNYVHSDITHAVSDAGAAEVNHDG
eukprot:CAMPEP_0202010230 /NCGR_PEP_ID=MMETSP0905-20130828/17217_1 /ASSEMBLY_ACC=CAM_ASM_000554 /TAXON_ID=420261 /ORGANISM="Thalassiosira antarctica, Strain CCMP982" /LENGTH=72 /DNA_ID=CAMNT_0048568823 /DNA_START=9 /DNA_END=224 /DNA_ORIENTATION=+